MAQLKLNRFINLSKIKDGEEMKFGLDMLDSLGICKAWDTKEEAFINEGDIIDTEKGEQKINRHVTLTYADKQRYKVRNIFRRYIIVDGEKKIVDLPSTAETQLLNLINHAVAIDKNPMDLVYVLKREGEGINTKWTVGMTGGDSGTESSQYTEEEQEIVDGLKDSPATQEYTNEQKIKVFVQNGISEERAKEIVNKVW